MRWKSVLLGVIVLLTTAGRPAFAEDELRLARFESTQIRMGVPCTITVYAPSEAVATAAFSAAFARLRDLNLILSDYDPDSELMRLCRESGPGKPVAASEELFTVLAKAREISAASGGAFDVTVGPFVQVWRKARRSKQLPTNDDLAAARRLVGYELVSLNAEKRTVELERAGMRLDLGGIAKGYAADEALRTVRSKGLPRALVAFAGDIVAGDPPPGETDWRVGVGPLENPDAPPKTFLRLANAAVSTSGDAFQFVEIGGTRYSHLVDPKTGLGLTKRSSVTVVAKTGILADGAASAVAVLGAERGRKLLDALKDVDGWIVERTADGTESNVETDRFQKHVEPR